MTWENVSAWLLRGFDTFIASAGFAACWLVALMLIGAVIALIDHRHDDDKHP